VGDAVGNSDGSTVGSVVGFAVGLPVVSLGADVGLDVGDNVELNEIIFIFDKVALPKLNSPLRLLLINQTGRSLPSQLSFVGVRAFVAM